MKKIALHLFIMLSLGSFMGCGQDSKFKNTPYTPPEAKPTPLPPSAYDEPPSSDKPLGYVSNHCLDVDEHQRIFYTYMKNANDKETYAALLESLGVCTTHTEPYQIFVNGYWTTISPQLESCDNFTYYPNMGVYIAFTKGSPNTAQITLQVQGANTDNLYDEIFYTKQVPLGQGSISCDRPDMQLNFQLSDGNWFQILAERQYGNKYSTDFRGKIFYKGTELQNSHFTLKAASN